MPEVGRGISSISPPIFLLRGVLIGIIGLILRRLFVQPKDFEFPANVPVQPEVRKGIFRDSTLVAGFIIFHVGCRLIVQGDAPGAEGWDSYQPVSSAFSAAFAGLAPGGQGIKSLLSGGAPWDRFFCSSRTFRAPNIFIFLWRR